MNDLHRASREELVEIIRQQQEQITGLLTRVTVLEDEKGTERAALLLFPDGSPALGLWQADGKERAALVLVPDGSSLRMRDKDGDLRARLAVGQDGASATFLEKRGTVLWSAPPAR